MKRRFFILLFMAVLLLSVSVCTAAGASKETGAKDNYKGTLEMETTEDGKSVNISYKVDGQKVSYTVPNEKQHLSGGYAGTDDLGRTLPSSLSAGIYGENEEHYVGLFYFLWHGEHGDKGVYNLQAIKDNYGKLAKDGNALDPETGNRIYGSIGAMHWFAEPLYGYYYASDEWVVRKHMELLSNAGVDFLYIDCTNSYTYKDNALQVMKACHELNQRGFSAPKIVFYTKNKSAETMAELYHEIYEAKKYPDTWFYVDGRPCIVGVQEGNINDFFTVKEIQWPGKETKNNSWPWMDFQWPQKVYRDTEGERSAINVSIAQHNKTLMSNSSLYGVGDNRGRSFTGEDGYTYDDASSSYGRNFQAQWKRALKADVPYVLVTGWNEWVAQRQNPEKLKQGKGFVGFVDTASVEYSRDAEMMRGGYFDNYYMQLAANISRLKGTAPVIVQDGRNKINVKKSFQQWNKVPVTYSDPSKDCLDRSNLGFGQTMYTDTSGNNDIIEGKVTHDTKNVYFYAKTRKAIKKPEDGGAWMQLFVNTNEDSEDGWYGYDYVINSRVKDEDTTYMASCSSSKSGKLVTKRAGSVQYKVNGNKIMIAVPQKMLDIDNYKKIYLEFKWADADEGMKFNEMEDFYLYGDAAPLGRLNWIYQSYIPKEQDTDRYHSFEDFEVVEKAGFGKKGKRTATCTTCLTKKKTKTIPAAVVPKIRDYTYNGKNQTPKIVVRNTAGGKVSAEVEFADKKRIKPGTYKVTVRLTGKGYSGKKTVTFRIKPAVDGK